MFFFKVLLDVSQRHLYGTAETALLLLRDFLDFPDRPFSLHAFCNHRKALSSGFVDVGQFWRSPYAVYTFKHLWEKGVRVCAYQPGRSRQPRPGPGHREPRDLQLERRHRQQEEDVQEAHAAPALRLR